MIDPYRPDSRGVRLEPGDGDKEEHCGGRDEVRQHEQDAQCGEMALGHRPLAGLTLGIDELTP